MLKEPMEILGLFPVRKTKQQKQAFRDAVQTYAKTIGYEYREEPGPFGCRNLVIGDPENAKYLVTAHYDTCARMVVPNFITPCNIPVYIGYQILLIFLTYASAVLAGLLVCFSVMVIYGFCAEPSIAEVMANLGTVTFTVVFIVLFVLNIAMMILGRSNPNNANDNTSGVVTLLEIARTMQENQRNKVCFVLFDLEEAGLIGSASYRKTHLQATNKQLILNLDCVGDGDELRMFPTKALRKNRVKLTSLYKACGYFGKKNLLVHEKGNYIYPSDQMRFPYGVGICALRKKKKTLYMSRIHTKKDTILDETNVNILRAALTTFICRDAVQ